MPVPLLELLEAKLPGVKRTTLRAMLAARRITVDGRPARSLKDVVPDGATLAIRDKPQRPKPSDELPVPAVYEDDDLLVVDKPAGMLTSSGVNDRRPTLIGMLRAHYAARGLRDQVGLIHRLDRDASGLLVLSKTGAAFAALKRQFADHSAQREYRAVVSGAANPKSGTIESYLLELPDGRVVETKNPTKSLRGVTHYERLETRGRGAYSLVAARLETGRKHQIRVHLAGLGHPIVGDAMYHPNPRLAPRMMLHAVRLALVHPLTDEPIEWASPLPDDVRDWWDALAAPTPPRRK